MTTQRAAKAAAKREALPFDSNRLRASGFSVLRAMVVARPGDDPPQIWALEIARTRLREGGNAEQIVAIGNVETRAGLWFFGATVITEVTLPDDVEPDSVADKALLPYVDEMFGETLYDAATLVVRQLAAMVQTKGPLDLPRHRAGASSNAR